MHSFFSSRKKNTAKIGCCVDNENAQKVKMLSKGSYLKTATLNVTCIRVKSKKVPLTSFPLQGVQNTTCTSSFSKRGYIGLCKNYLYGSVNDSSWNSEVVRHYP